MATINYNTGLAGFETTDRFDDIELLAGDKPSVFTENHSVGAEQELAMFSVVALDDLSGNVVLATLGTPAIGILVSPVSTGVGEEKNVAVFRGGCFNPAALTFDASYTTDAEKMAAFAGAPAPTQITLKRTLA